MVVMILPAVIKIGSFPKVLALGLAKNAISLVESTNIDFLNRSSTNLSTSPLYFLFSSRIVILIKIDGPFLIAHGLFFYQIYTIGSCKCHHQATCPECKNKRFGTSNHGFIHVLLSITNLNHLIF